MQTDQIAAEGNSRRSNYELLRLLAGAAVIILHFNFLPGHGGAMENASGITYYVLLFLEALCASAVNIFLLLSGYFNYKTERIRTGKLIGLLLQTICFALVMNMVFSIIYHRWDIKVILGSLIPANYYVILYITLMILAPYINRLMNSLAPKKLSCWILILIMLFSVYSTGVDILKEVTGNEWQGLSSIGIEGSMSGYTIVNFALVYMLGIWLRRTELNSKFGLPILISVSLGCVLFIMLWRRVLPNTAWIYNNPVLILESCTIFMIFGKIKLSSKWINSVAKASFTCYLIHGNLLILMQDRISNAKPLHEVLLLMAAMVIGIYLISFIAMRIWEVIIAPLRKRIGKCIPDIQV